MDYGWVRPSIVYHVIICIYVHDPSVTTHVHQPQMDGFNKNTKHIHGTREPQDTSMV